jgi:hypothetical protein
VNPCAAAEQSTLVACATAAVLAVLLAVVVARWLRLRVVASRLIRTELDRRKAPRPERRRRPMGFGVRP